MKRLLMFLLVVSAVNGYAQRTLPYPIIFVHGWTGSDATWYGMGEMLKSQGVNISLDDVNRRGGEGSVIDFHLNADGDNLTTFLNRTGGPYDYADVYDYNSYINPNNDVFFVNFERYTIPPSTAIKEYSNQAAAVKQGFAIGLAIKKVLNATKAKKVILVGHSMGGLAIREYLQNSANWLLGDSQHHVAKLVTIGTPHGGSNANSGGILNTFSSATEWSEAVRDLRFKRDGDLFDRGVYLFGGFEDDIKRVGRYDYFNNDVDCDSKYNGYVVGLNQKTPLPSDLTYSCVIGLGGKFIFPPFTTGSTGDDIVEGSRASFFDVQGNTIRYKIPGDTFFADQAKKEPGDEQYYSIQDKSSTGNWHSKLTKQRFINMYALDEASGVNLYEVETGKSYLGFLTPRPNTQTNLAFASRFDSDGYYLEVPQSGLLTVDFSANASTNGFLELYPRGADKSILTLNTVTSSKKQIMVEPGTYMIVIYGSSGNGNASWEFNRYKFSTSLCPMPTSISITATKGNNVFCEGGSVTLTATQGFDQYKWYKDGVQINNTTNEIVATQTGTYSTESFKCDRTVSSANYVNVFVRPVPSKPIISKEEQPDKFILTTSSVEGNQWFLNGAAISGATAKTYIPQEVGVYSVSTTKDQCSNVSEPMTVKLEKPIISYNGSTAFFEGDSLLLVAPMGYSQYNWTLEDKPFAGNQQKLPARKSGNYRVSTQRGKMVSEFSEPIPIVVSPVLSVEPAPTLSVKLYPNPNKGTFWVELPENRGNWQMEVLDIQGKQVLRKKHLSGFKNRESIELKSPAGTYFLKVSNNDLIQTIKFVVE